MQKVYQFLIVITTLFVLSCNKNNTETNQIIIEPVVTKGAEIKAVDASFLPEVRASGVVIKNENGVAEDMLTTFKRNSINTVRIRLWKRPNTVRSGFSEVKALAQEVKNMGLKVWLSVQYSDTWADPGTQQKPSEWLNANYTQLKDSVYAYTKKIVTEINPDYIQIGNEINSGFLWPDGNINTPTQMIELVKQGVKAVRDNSSTTKIIIHYAGHEYASTFYAMFTAVDYDIIGLSYYPIWHGKNLQILQNNINALGSQYNKDVVIAETAYPFTFGYNDYTNNIIGNASQILPDYTATSTGQLAYLSKIRTIMQASPRGIGFCYWGGDWVALYGPTATNGSSFENQAFWDFNNTALPALGAFKN